MKNRRAFCQKSIIAVAGIVSYGVMGCKSKKEKPVPEIKNSLKLSLAQWSLHKAFFAKELDPINFAPITASYDIKAVEYVNQFYVEHVNNEPFWMEMQQRASGEGVNSLLIMVDDEGDLGDPDSQKRKEAAINHQKWINAAKLMDCHSIRVNAFGSGTKSEMHGYLVDGLSQLCEYASKENINVLIENHGLYSSDAQWVTNVIKAVDSSFLGTLPDFGNWCMNEKWGSTKDDACTDSYDLYNGVKEFMPYAKGVSAKSYDFNEDGTVKGIDYNKMIDLVKAEGYDGYVGIEYEGENLSEPDGIRATKALLEKYWVA